MTEKMSPEGSRILHCFRTRNLRAGGFIPFPGFGEAIVWDEGFVRDEPVRRALALLIAQAYVTEMGAGLELTELGEQYINDDQTPKHGARVYLIGDKLLIKQTVLRGTPAEYVIDEHRERHVGESDDLAIAMAIRDAVNGLM